MTTLLDAWVAMKIATDNIPPAETIPGTRAYWFGEAAKISHSQKVADLVTYISHLQTTLNEVEGTTAP